MNSLKRLINNLLNSKSSYHGGDKILIYLISAIVFFGLIMLSSASSVMAYSRFKNSYYYFNHQLFGLLLGLIAFWFFSNVDYHRWKKYALHFLAFSIFLLLLVFIPGLSAHYGKARSWINIFGFSLQPSEFVKLSFLLYLSAWLEARGKKLGELSQGIGPFLAVLGMVAVLMILQPDIGTLSIISLIALIVYYVGGGKFRHVLVIILSGVIALVIMVQIKPYQMNRFKCMADPSFSSGDVCYQVNQSLIAIGSGGFWGRGLGQSRQKFMYLPEVSGDSIFAIISEETGMFFSTILIFLYSYLFYRGYLISKNAPDGFGKILSIGIVSWITFQALINIGGMISLIPMTGVPLPLISYGGSSMMAALAALGMLVNISKQTK